MRFIPKKPTVTPEEAALVFLESTIKNSKKVWKKNHKKINQLFNGKREIPSDHWRDLFLASMAVELQELSKWVTAEQEEIIREEIYSVGGDLVKGKENIAEYERVLNAWLEHGTSPYLGVMQLMWDNYIKYSGAEFFPNTKPEDPNKALYYMITSVHLGYWKVYFKWHNLK